MAESSFERPSSRGFLAVVGVFALGVVFGAALTVVLMRVIVGPRPFGPLGRPERAVSRMARTLELDAGQEEKLRTILERSHREIGEILGQTHEEIREMLRPDQREKFDRMRPPPPDREPRP